MSNGESRLPRVLACVTILGGALIAWGSQWRFTSGYALATARSGAKGTTILTNGSGSPLLHRAYLSSWALLTLLIAAILLMSLAADVATARLARESVGWGLLVVALLVALYLAYVGLRTSGTSSAVGVGYELAAGGCLFALFGSSLWIHAARGQRPRGSLASA